MTSLSRNRGRQTESRVEANEVGDLMPVIPVRTSTDHGTGRWRRATGTTTLSGHHAGRRSGPALSAGPKTPHHLSSGGRQPGPSKNREWPEAGAKKRTRAGRGALPCFVRATERHGSFARWRARSIHCATARLPGLSACATSYSAIASRYRPSAKATFPRFRCALRDRGKIWTAFWK